MAQSFIRAARGLCSLSLYSHLLCHHLINDTITASRRCTKAKASRTPPYPACPLLPPHIPNFPFNFLPRSTPRPVPLRARAPRDPRSEAGGGGASPSERVVAPHWPSRSANGKRPSGTPTFGGAVAAGGRAGGQWERAARAFWPMAERRRRGEGRWAYKNPRHLLPPPQCRAAPGRDGRSECALIPPAMSPLSVLAPVLFGALLAAAGPTQFFREEFGDGGEGGAGRGSLRAGPEGGLLRLKAWGGGA